MALRASGRASLRERMLASPLCDADGAAWALEHAYRTMWHRFVGHVPAKTFDPRLAPVA